MRRRTRGGAWVAALATGASIAGLSGLMIASRPVETVEVTTGQSDDARVDRFSGAPIPSEVNFGLHLIGELNCVACHATDDAILDRLVVKRAPLLDDIGARMDPGYMLKFIMAPHAVKPGTTMPGLFSAPRPAMVEPIVHYLVSLGGPMPHEEEEFNEVDIENGRVLYHQVGCVACHAPQEPPSVLQPAFVVEAEDEYGVIDESDHTIPDLARPSAPLGELGLKTNVAQLTEFLVDPLATRPSGHMPSMKLTRDEARAIAAYLLRDRPDEPWSEASFEIDPAKVEQGRQIYDMIGCAACHTMNADDEPAPHGMARPLEALDPAAPDGCLGENPAPVRARYDLTADERTAIRDVLANLEEFKTPPSDDEWIATRLAALNCLACHDRDELGGPEEGRRHYFMSLEETDLGDEGRIPPTLSGVGAKLHTSWVREVLEHGAAVRPYMGTRMPQFGAQNVRDLPRRFEAVDFGDAGPAEDEFNRSLADAGRFLVGANGLKCIDCHSFAGHESLASPGPDLATAHERIRSGWFHEWLENPYETRPGTRMPTFWPEGRSAFPDLLEGDMNRQIDAIWAYLSLGEFAPLPEGVEAEQGYELVVRDEPVVFRTFVDGAGSRAIAVGFPEQIHCVFDAHAVRLAAVWRGRFLSASGAWAGRGGSAVDPLGDAKTMPDGAPFARLDTLDEAWPDETGELAGLRMKGYRLDDEGRPIFRYTIFGAPVEERPIARLNENGASFTREFRYNPSDIDQPLWLRVAKASSIDRSDRHAFVTDDGVEYELRIPEDWRTIVRETGAGDELLLEIPAGDDRIDQSTAFEVEMKW
ncbi:MAG: c-type cytochrome [Phycisphaerales bacterium]